MSEHFQRPTYHKIPSCLERDPTTRRLVPDAWATDDLRYLAHCAWNVTEKVDGTNMRIHVDRETSAVGGRTERSQMPVQLLNRCSDIGDYAVEEGLYGLTLYGEGYGEGIQRGGAYRSDQGFILFDVVVTATGMMLKHQDVVNIASKLDIPVVPTLGVTTLAGAVDLFVSHDIPDSRLRDGKPEGWVLRPTQELRSRRGDRIITKLKVKDFV